MFSNGLQREADERRFTRLNSVCFLFDLRYFGVQLRSNVFFCLKLFKLNNDVPDYNLDQLTARNNQRLKKLRDIEGKNCVI
jgi:hypothetical protein